MRFQVQSLAHICRSRFMASLDIYCSIVAPVAISLCQSLSCREIARAKKWLSVQAVIARHLLDSMNFQSLGSTCSIPFQREHSEHYRFVQALIHSLAHGPSRSSPAPIDEPSVALQVLAMHW